MKVHSNAGFQTMSPIVEGPSQRESLEQPRLGRDLSMLNGHEPGQSPLQFAMTKMAALFTSPGVDGECPAASSHLHSNDVPVYARAILGLSHDDSEIDETLAPYLDELSKNESAIQAQPVTRSAFSLLCMLYLADQAPGSAKCGPLALSPTAFREWLQCQLPDCDIRDDLIPAEYFETTQLFTLTKNLPKQYVIKCSHLDEAVAAIVTSIRPTHSRIDAQSTSQQDVNPRLSKFRSVIVRRADARDSSYLDLRGVDLRGAILRGVDLQYAMMEGAKLQGADLRGASLHGVDLKNADLHGANLRGTRLARAKLIGVNLQGSNLQDANLEHTSLYGSNLRGADLQNARLGDTSLLGANLQSANLRGAKLEGMDLQGTNLANAELEGANLLGANLQNANLCGVNLRGSNLKGTNLRGANLQNANLRDVDLQDKDLRNTNLQGANLQGVKLRGADIRQADLRGANLQGNYLSSLDLHGMDLQYANLRGATLDYTSLRGANLRGANLEGASLHGTFLENAILHDANLRGVDLRIANFHDVTLQGVNLEGARIGADLSRTPVQNALLDWHFLFREDVNSLHARLVIVPDDVLKSGVASAIGSRSAANLDLKFNHRNNDGRSVLRNINNIDDRCRPQKQVLMRAVIAELDNVRMHNPEIIADLIPSLGDVLFQDPEYLKGYDDFARWMYEDMLDEGQFLLDDQITDSALTALGEYIAHRLETGGLDVIMRQSVAFYQVLHAIREHGASASSSADQEQWTSRAQTIHDRYIGILSDSVTSLVGTGSVYENERDILGDDDIFPLLSADGRSCVIMSDEYFNQLVLRREPRAAEGRSEWNNLRCVQAQHDGTFPASVANATSGGTRGTASTAPILAQFPLLHNARQVDKATETQQQILALSGLTGTLLERFEAALRQSNTSDNMVEDDDQMALGTIFETKYEDRGGQVHLAAAHFAALQAHWQDDQPQDFAFRLLCMSALYTNYASSHVFGTEFESPNALRAYAEGLLRKAHELDPGLIKDDTLADWINRLRGEGNAFTCTSVLYGIQSRHLGVILRGQPDNGTLHQIRNEVIPLTWR